MKAVASRRSLLAVTKTAIPIGRRLSNLIPLMRQPGRGEDQDKDLAVMAHLAISVTGNLRSGGSRTPSSHHLPVAVEVVVAAALVMRRMIGQRTVDGQGLVRHLGR